MERHTFGILDEVKELHDLGLVESATAQARVYPAVSLFKIYVINTTDLFYGYYPIERHDLVLEGEPTTMLDLTGKNTVLFHMERDSVDPESFKSQFIAQSQQWFDSAWSIGREIQP